MMKLLLIQPPDIFMHQRYPFLGLASLAAIAESRGWTVEVAVAANLNPDSAQKQIIRQAARFSPDIIGISILTFSAKTSYALINRLKLPGRVIIAGGPHPSSLPEETLGHSACDIVVRGEGEETFSRLLELYETGNKELEGIAGISFKGAAGQMIHNPDRPLLCEEKLDLLPHPAKHLFLNKHFPASGLGNIAASRGCPFNCTFCSKGVFKNTHRLRSCAGVLAEIQELHSRYGIDHFYFVDDVFTLQRGWVEELCAKIIESGLFISWHCFSRIDCIDEALLKTMRRAGCLYIIYGVESVNPGSLEKIQKKITLEETKRVLELTRNSGMGIFLALLWGFPWETAADADKLVEFIKEVYPWVYFIDLNRIVVFPETELYAAYSKQYNFQEWWLKDKLLGSRLHLYQQLRYYPPNTERPFFPLPAEIIQKMDKAHALIDERLILTANMIRRGDGQYTVIEPAVLTGSISFRFKRLIKLCFIRSSILLAAYAPAIELNLLVPLYKITESAWSKLRGRSFGSNKKAGQLR